MFLKLKNVLYMANWFIDPNRHINSENSGYGTECQQLIVIKSYEVPLCEVLYHVIPIPYLNFVGQISHTSSATPALPFCGILFRIPQGTLISELCCKEQHFCCSFFWLFHLIIYFPQLLYNNRAYFNCNCWEKIPVKLYSDFAQLFSRFCPVVKHCTSLTMQQNQEFKTSLIWFAFLRHFS